MALRNSESNIFIIFFPFLDQRYIKIDGKPIFIIYRPDIISCFDRMVRCWRKLAKENGFLGLYIMVTNPRTNYEWPADGILLYESGYTWNNGVLDKQNVGNVGSELYKFDEIWHKILYILEETRKNCLFFCTFVRDDDLPRRGKDGCVVVNKIAQKFALYLKLLLKKSENKK